MQDPKSWPLDTSLYRRPEPEPHRAAAELHRGWCAKRAGLPWDEMETDAWKAGWDLRLSVEWHGAVTPRPVVFPPT